MRKLGVFNREIGTDSRMFVDPKMLANATDEFAGAHDDLLDYFAKVIALIRQAKSQTDKDIFWFAAQKAMRFKETSYTGLGCSEDGNDGNGIGKVLAHRIVTRAAEVLPHADFQPEVFEIIGVFTERLGCDRISDMIVSILKPRFLAYTSRITKSLNIKEITRVEFSGKTYICPQFDKGDKPIILVPRVFLKPLPIAVDLEEALDKADLNDQTRSAANKLFDEARERGAASPKTSELRSFILTRPSIFKVIVDGYKRTKGIPYDFDLDPRKVSDFNAIAREITGKPVVSFVGLDAWGRVETCVKETIKHFQHSIEHNRLSDILYDDDGTPRKELIAQRTIFAVANIFGKITAVRL